MIIRTKASTEVCLRCQLRLSGQLRASRPRVPTPGSRQGFRGLSIHATSRLAQAQDDSHKKDPEAHNYESTSKSDSRGSKQWTESSAPGAASQDGPQSSKNFDRAKRLSALPGSRMFGVSGSKLTERTEGLSVDSLGRPSEVIVLQDSRSIRYVAPRPVPVEIEAPKVDILAQFNSERGLIGKEEVNQNIESLRPQKTVLSWAEIRDVEVQLGTGFTMSQLLYYIECSENERMAAFHKHETSEIQTGKITKEMARNKMAFTADQKLEDQSVVVRQSPWMPGTSDQGDQFDESPLRGYMSDAFTSKQRVALNILRFCWGIEAEELLASVGEIELQVKGTGLDLLLSPKARWVSPLQVISNELVQSEEEKLEIFRSRNAIRITAGKGKANIIAQRIRKILEGEHQVEVSLTPLKKLGRKTKGVKQAKDEEFGEPVLAELSRLSDTEIVRGLKDKLEIHGFGREADSKLSTTADVARRLLLSSSDAADTAVYMNNVQKTDSPVYAVDYDYRHTMSWRNRLRQWSRWQAAIGKLDPEGSRIIGKDDTQASDVSEAIDEALESQVKNSTPAGLPVSTNHKAAQLNEKQKKQYELEESNLWSTASFTSTTATVGNVLHEVSIPGSVDVSKPVDFDGNDITNSRTLFVPSTKNLSRLVAGLEGESGPPRLSLTMKFLPSPWSKENGESPLASFPTLEMRFDIQQDALNSFVLTDFLAITEDVCNNVMLPDKTLDIRFRQRTCFPFIGKNISAHPQITAFLNASEQTNRISIKMPPDLVVPIPNFMCNVKSGTSDAKDTSTDVRYLFAGLSYRTNIDYYFQDWCLEYSSVNSGKADGRHAEVTLHPTRKNMGAFNDTTDSVEPNQQLSTDYINSAYDLVDALESLDKPVARATIKQPVEGDSEDMPQDLGHGFRGSKLTSGRLRYFPKNIDFKDADGDATS